MKKNKKIVAALVLAAGSSTRMGANKLLADFNGRPMIVQTVAQIEASQVNQIVVVTGHQAAKIEAALRGEPVSFTHNPDYVLGLSTSLRVGVAALIGKADAILVCLGDMPLIDPADINKMIDALDYANEKSVVVPIYAGQMGNPVLWAAKHIQALMACEGDRGARGLLEKLKNETAKIEIGNPRVVLDADTPEGLAKLRAIANSEN